MLTCVFDIFPYRQELYNSRILGNCWFLENWQQMVSSTSKWKHTTFNPQLIINHPDNWHAQTMKTWSNVFAWVLGIAKAKIVANTTVKVQRIAGMLLPGNNQQLFTVLVYHNLVRIKMAARKWWRLSIINSNNSVLERNCTSYFREERGTKRKAKPILCKRKKVNKRNNSNNKRTTQHGTSEK